MDKRRVLPVIGGFNFRDIGGYTSFDGRKIKWGKAFRTAGMADLSPEDLKYLEDRQVDTIIDFRTEAEVAKGPDRVPAHAVDINIPAMDFDRTESTVDYAQLSKEYDQKGYGYLNMINNYEHLISDEYSNIAYRKFFDLLMTENKTLAYHCTAGKDRTGVASMLLMSALGINEAQIKHDYLITDRLSTEVVRNKIEHMKAEGATPDEIENIHSMWSVNIDYIQRSIDTVKRLSGDPITYLQDYLQLQPADIQLLRDKYLFSEPTDKQ
ncbi:MAG: tyrosine-protein phosphatase [Oenococcus sp.]|uniref:tyrosine-protein phosphatase n=1 Tax=Oenococcus sp. TaxID=1979414 RepID=UPI0039EBE230